MNTTTATVETLTAEVQVLQVGSRQVTMSVYKQLDWMQPHLVEPFGRVRTKVSENDPDTVEIVGKAPDGSLVASEIYRPSWRTLSPSDAFADWASHVAFVHPSPLRAIAKDTYDRTDMWLIDAKVVGAQTLQWTVERHQLRCHSPQHPECDLAQLERAWRTDADAAFEFLAKRQALYDRMKALPLIVLAGLR